MAKRRTTAAFRVVHADDLRDSRGHSFAPRSGELRHQREQKLVRTIPIRDGRALPHTYRHLAPLLSVA